MTAPEEIDSEKRMLLGSLRVGLYGLAVYGVGRGAYESLRYVAENISVSAPDYAGAEVGAPLAAFGIPFLAFYGKKLYDKYASKRQQDEKATPKKTPPRGREAWCEEET